MNKYRLTLHRQVSDGNDVKTFTIFTQDYEPKQATPFDESKVSGLVQIKTDSIENVFATLSLVNAEGEVIPLSSQIARLTDKGFSASTRASVPALNGFLRLSANFNQVSGQNGAYQANLTLTEVGTMSTTRQAILSATRPVNSAMKRAQREVRDYKARGEKIAEIDRIYSSVGL